MRRIITIIVLIAVCFQCFVQIGIVSWYELNKDFVSRTICEKRNQPQSGCNGKCYLKKQLVKATGREKDSSKPLESNASVEIQVFILPEQLDIGYCVAAEEAQYHETKESQYLWRFSYSVFHPPQC